MPTPGWLAEQFEQHRAHLRAVAYRMLGSASEAEDAVQEGWIRLGRTDVSDVENLRDQRRSVDAFLAAVRDGDFEALVAVLDPGIVLRADGGAPGSRT